MQWNKIYSLIVFYLFLNSMFLPVFADVGGENPVPVAVPVVETSTNSFACTNTSLGPKQVQKLYDETINKGFTGGELSSGTEPDLDRDVLDQNTLLVKASDELAIEQEMPSQKINPEEVSHLINTHYNGPFAFGIVLEDTIRIGRCESKEAGELDLNSCMLQGKNLAYRNSGEGIKQNFGNVWDDFKSIFVEKPPELSAEEYENLRAKFTEETGATPDEVKELKTVAKTMLMRKKIAQAVATIAQEAQVMKTHPHQLLQKQKTRF